MNHIGSFEDKILFNIKKLNLHCQIYHKLYLLTKHTLPYLFDSYRLYSVTFSINKNHETAPKTSP